MLRTTITLLGTTLFMATSRPVGGVRTVTIACNGADEYTADQIAALEQKLHSTSSIDSAFVKAAALPYVADTAIAVVTDSATCATALAAHNQAAGYTASELSTPSAASVYLLRFGTTYLTMNPAFPSGEWVEHLVWDSSFHSLGSFLY